MSRELSPGGMQRVLVHLALVPREVVQINEEIYPTPIRSATAFLYICVTDLPEIHHKDIISSSSRVGISLPRR